MEVGRKQKRKKKKTKKREASDGMVMDWGIEVESRKERMVINKY